MHVIMPRDHFNALVKTFERIEQLHNSVREESAQEFLCELKSLADKDAVKNLSDLFKQVKAEHDALIENPEEREPPITIPVFIGRRLTP